MLKPSLPPRKKRPVNEAGRPIGEGHHKTILKDWELEVLFELREAGWGYTRLAAHFDISRRTVRDYCCGRSRCQTPARWV